MKKTKKNNDQGVSVCRYREVKRLKLQFDALCELIRIRVNRGCSRKGRDREGTRRLEDHIIVMGIEFLAGVYAFRNSH